MCEPEDALFVVAHADTGALVATTVPPMGHDDFCHRPWAGGALPGPAYSRPDAVYGTLPNGAAP